MHTIYMKQRYINYTIIFLTLGKYNPEGVYYYYYYY